MAKKTRLIGSIRKLKCPPVTFKQIENISKAATNSNSGARFSREKRRKFNFGVSIGLLG